MLCWCIYHESDRPFWIITGSGAWGGLVATESPGPVAIFNNFAQSLDKNGLRQGRATRACGFAFQSRPGSTINFLCAKSKNWAFFPLLSMRIGKPGESQGCRPSPTAGAQWHSAQSNCSTSIQHGISWLPAGRCNFAQHGSTVSELKVHCRQPTNFFCKRKVLLVKNATNARQSQKASDPTKLSSGSTGKGMTPRKKIEIRWVLMGKLKRWHARNWRQLVCWSVWSNLRWQQRSLKYHNEWTVSNMRLNGCTMKGTWNIWNLQTLVCRPPTWPKLCTAASLTRVWHHSGFIWIQNNLQRIGGTPLNRPHIWKAWYSKHEERLLQHEKHLWIRIQL